MIALIPAVTFGKSPARKWRTRQEGEGGCGVVNVGEGGPCMSVSIASTLADVVSSSVMILCRREGPSVVSVGNGHKRLEKKKVDGDTTY
jgi:hypothetical protein